MCQLSWNMGPSTSWNPQGLSRPVMGLLYQEKLKMLSYPIEVQTTYSYGPFFALHCTSCHVFCIEFVQFLLFLQYSFLQVVQGYKHWRNVKVIFHKAQQRRHNAVRSGDRGSQEVDRPSPIHNSTTSCWRMLSLHFGCLMSFLHFEKQYLVCLQVPGNHPHQQNVALDIPLTVCHEVEYLIQGYS